MVKLSAIVVGATAGTVLFYDRDVLLANVPLRDGVATLKTDTLHAGTHLIHAVFSGDDFVGPSRSPAIYVTVDGAPTPKRRSAR